MNTYAPNENGNENENENENGNNNYPIKIVFYSVTPNVNMLIPCIRRHIGIVLEDFLKNFIQDVYVRYIDDGYRASIMGDFTEIPIKVCLKVYEIEYLFQLIS